MSRQEGLNDLQIDILFYSDWSGVAGTRYILHCLSGDVLFKFVCMDILLTAGGGGVDGGEKKVLISSLD